MEGWPAPLLVLGPQWRTDGDVRAKPAAGGIDANLGFGGAWLLVCQEFPIPAIAADAKPALDASAGRYGVLSRRGGTGALCGRAQNGAFFSQDKLQLALDLKWDD